MNVGHCDSLHHGSTSTNLLLYDLRACGGITRHSILYVEHRDTLRPAPVSCVSYELVQQGHVV